MRYMPRLDFMRFCSPGGRVKTWGRVMNAPPSIGHDLIRGSWSIVVLPCATGARNQLRIGSAFHAEKGAPA